MAASIHQGASMGPVTLTVRDLDRARDFYGRVVGLSELGDGGTGRARLGTASGRSLVELVGAPPAPTRPARTTGLFHLAILLPSRIELARSLRRLIDARWPLAGASDHLVSEALYLSDPEGNGIEIYSDRPPETWIRDGDELRMATLPLDLRGVMAEMGEGDDRTADPEAGLSPGARIGHVHLNVADLDAAEAFYGGLLGFDVTARGYPGALFLSAGGYHHHIGLNIWRGEGAPPPPTGAAGLREIELVLPDGDALDAAVGRLRRGGVEVAERSGRGLAHDPSRNPVALAVAGA